jgi:hypothetical protein
MRAWVALAVLILIGAGAFGAFETGIVPMPEVIGKFMRPAAPTPALPGIELKSLTSQTGYLQGSFVISNSNAFPVADTAIHCDLNDPGGAIVHSFDFTVDELVPANEKKLISNYKFGFWPQQSSQMRCRSVSFQRR